MGELKIEDPDPTVTDSHYREIAERYTDYLSYSGDFVPTLARKMADLLRLSPDDVFVDLGGGTGIYTSAILEHVQLRTRVRLVDFSAEMLEQALPGLPVEKIHMDAMTFANKSCRYDKMLIKETIHHVDDHERFLRLIFGQLSRGGSVLLVHVPPELDYPLFDAALTRARSWHADPDALERALGAAGFAVSRDCVEWQHCIPKERYFDMVASRYMSVLSSFTDEELQEGLLEMAQTYADTDLLRWTDHFDYLVGHKPPR
jgi:ubiquinone/menaquinone biosynthesis C-methylase UbiE